MAQSIFKLNNSNNSNLTSVTTLNCGGTGTSSFKTSLLNTGTLHIDNLLNQYTQSRFIEFSVVGATTAVATGNNQAYFHVPSVLNRYRVTSAHAMVITTGTGATTDIQITRNRSGSSVNLFSSVLKIDGSESGTDTAANAYAINSANRDLQTNDVLAVNVEAVNTSAPLGLIVTLEARN